MNKTKLPEIQVSKEIKLSEELKILLDMIALFRDINNDFPGEIFKNEFKEMEKLALEIFKSLLLKQENGYKVNLVIIGNFSSGKSSIINSVLKENVCPSKVNPTTSSITKFVYGKNKKIFLIKENGIKEEISQQDYLRLSQHQFKNNNTTRSFFFEYQYPSEFLIDFIIYDTPGFENPQNKNDDKLTEKIFIEESDIVIFVQDISKSSLEEKTLKRIKELQHLKKNLPWILILNKADAVSETDIQQITEYWNKSENKSLFEDIIIYSAKNIIDLHYNEKNKEKIKEKIFDLLLQDKGLMVNTRDKTTSLFKTTKNLNRKVKIMINSCNNNNNAEFDFEIISKREMIKESYSKFLKALKNLSNKKEEIFNKKLNKLRKQFLLKSLMNIEKIRKKTNPEIFEPIKNYKEALNMIKQAEQDLISKLKDTTIENGKEKETILKDCKKFTELVFKQKNIEIDYSQLRIEAKTPLELIKQFYMQILKLLEGQLISLKDKANSETAHVKNKLQQVDKLIEELRVRYQYYFDNESK